MKHESLAVWKQFLKQQENYRGLFREQHGR